MNPVLVRDRKPFMKLVHYILVRHLSYKSVIAHVEVLENGFRLVKVTPSDGPMPDVHGLLGRTFKDKASVRSALIERLRHLPGLGKDMNVINRVLLTASTWERWQKALETELTPAERESLPPLSACINDDGTLTLYLEVGEEEEIYLDVPTNEWRWYDLLHESNNDDAGSTACRSESAPAVQAK